MDLFRDSNGETRSGHLGRSDIFRKDKPIIPFRE